MVVGEIDVSAWADQEGKPRASLELTARDVRFLGGGRDEAGGDVGNMPPMPQNEEDIPF
jgi:single-stranded DNA-binding protein